MLKSDLLKIMTALAEVYPKFVVNEMKTNIFYDLLKDLEYPVLETAVKKHIVTSEFPPTIAELRKLATEIKNPSLQVTAADAWGEVTKAIRYFGWYRSEEALASMSEGARKIAQYIGWQNICEAENLDVLRGQFFKMYGQVETREKTEALLPEGLKKDIKALTDCIGKPMLGGGER
jgi:hypothetical protein